MRFLLGFLTLSFCLATPTGTLRFSPYFYSSTSTTGVLDFDGQLEFEYVSDDEAQIKTAAQWAAENQVLYLFGGMARGWPPGVPKLSHTITGLTVSPKAGGPGKRIVDYHYSGEVQIGNGSTSGFSVALPIRPYSVFDEGTIAATGADAYPCTDPHYAVSSVFWYFWDPSRANCPLREGVNYKYFPAKIQRGKNTTTTYPEYARLVDSDTIKVHIIFGMNDESLSEDPLTSTDYNASNFRSVRSELKRLGYSLNVWTAADTQKIVPGTPLPYVEEWTKKAALATVTVRMVFTPVSYWVTGYRKLFVAALEDASVIIYNGHSGFGQNLDLARLSVYEGRTIQMPQDRYQIVHFNGCSSYPYYVNGYFQNKVSAKDPNGTQQLDVLANGLMTSFGVMGSNTLTILYAIHNWAQRRGSTSYQTLASRIDSQNLFSVSGDEDNP